VPLKKNRNKIGQYTVSGKKHPEHYRLSLEDGFTNFNNFGINISGTTGHQMTGYFTTSSNVCFCTTWEKLNQRNMQ